MHLQVFLIRHNIELVCHKLIAMNRVHVVCDINGIIKKAVELRWFLAYFENSDVLVATGTNTPVGRGLL